MRPQQKNFNQVKDDQKNSQNQNKLSENGSNMIKHMHRPETRNIADDMPTTSNTEYNQ